jgi:hypothetical protein
LAFSGSRQIEQLRSEVFQMSWQPFEGDVALPQFQSELWQGPSDILLRSSTIHRMAEQAFQEKKNDEAA